MLYTADRRRTSLGCISIDCKAGQDWRPTTAQIPQPTVSHSKRTERRGKHHGRVRVHWPATLVLVLAIELDTEIWRECRKGRNSVLQVGGDAETRRNRYEFSSIPIAQGKSSERERERERSRTKNSKTLGGFEARRSETIDLVRRPSVRPTACPSVCPSVRHGCRSSRKQFA